MPRFSLFFPAGFLLALSISAAAHATGDAAPSAPLSALAQDRAWLNLIHYEPARFSATGWRSAIHSAEFFLAPDGRNDPAAELQATLAAFDAPPAAKPDEHAQCRFPARLLWLKAKLGEGAFRTDIRCPAFGEWTQGGSVSSLSVVYATGYLGNPASYFGHLLLKFNFRDTQGKSGLLDVSVNYGAILDKKNDAAVTYLIKCLIGGYDGAFSHIRFYFHEHNYGDTELRDLWEYRLDLPPEAVNLIVAHAWEVVGKRYTYFFFRRNCAFRMADLLQVADGVHLVPDMPPWVIPQSVAQTLGQATYRDKPLLADVVYHPSRQSRFYARYRSLSPQETDTLHGLVENRYGFGDPGFQALPLASQQAVLDAELDYYQFVGTPMERAPAETKAAYARALATRYALPPGTVDVPQPQPASPHEGHPPGWAQAGWWHNSVTGSAMTLRIRPAYYDVLDTDSSHVLNAALGVMDTQINIRQGQVYLNRLAVIDVDSVTPGLSGLPGDGGAAWRLRAGVEQARLWCDNCPAARLQGDGGYGRQWAEGLFGAVYVGGALQSNTAGQGAGFARISGSLIVKPADAFGMRLAYEQRFPFQRQQGSYGVLAAEARYALGMAGDLRLRYEHDRATVLGVGLGLYW